MFDLDDFLQIIQNTHLVGLIFMCRGNVVIINCIIFDEEIRDKTIDRQIYIDDPEYKVYKVLNNIIINNDNFVLFNSGEDHVIYYTKTGYKIFKERFIDMFCDYFKAKYSDKFDKNELNEFIRYFKKDSSDEK